MLLITLNFHIKINNYINTSNNSLKLFNLPGKSYNNYSKSKKPKLQLKLASLSHTNKTQLIKIMSYTNHPILFLAADQLLIDNPRNRLKIRFRFRFTGEWRPYACLFSSGGKQDVDMMFGFDLVAEDR